MENPATWNEIEVVIHKAMVEADLDFVNNIIGKSYTRYIYDALVKEGYVKEVPDANVNTSSISKGAAVSSDIV